MELSQLIYFKKVAELEHFTQAAEELHIAQPSLSKAIANLENELGVPLFERHKKRVFLNDYGRAFLRHVDRMLLELSDARTELLDMANALTGDLYIATSFPLEPQSRIFRYIHDFYMEHEGISFHLFSQDNPTIRRLLKNRQIDFGFTIGQPIDDPEIENVPLFSFRLGLSVSTSHPLADKKEVWLRDLKDEVFLCNNASPEQRDSIYELCHLAGFNPRIAFEGESPEIIGDALEAGRGIAFISKERYTQNVTREKLAGIPANKVFVDVLDPYARRSVSMYYLKSRYMTQLSRLFYDNLVEVFKQG